MWCAQSAATASCRPSLPERTLHSPAPKALDPHRSHAPAIDWVALVRGFGMPDCSVGTDSELAGALSRALAEGKLGLVEAVIG